MLNNQTAPPISILPDEILTLIFSYLSPRELLNAKLVAKLWQSISNEPAIWRNLINQYFPYLRQQNQNSPQVGPKALFTREFLRINGVLMRHAEYTTIKPYLFASLAGDIGKIEKLEISDEAKNQLYIYAATNGHLEGLSKLTVYTKGEALKLAAQNGYLPACQMILTQAGQEEILTQHKGWALKRAAENGHLNVVQALLTQAGHEISAQDKGRALAQAASNDHLAVVQALLIQAGHEISAQDKGRALAGSAKNGHLEVVQALLTQAGLQISAEHKCEALKDAATMGHLNVVQFLLTQAGHQISAEDKGRALISAAYEHHEVVQALLTQVQALLTQVGHQVLKGAVLEWAAKNGYLDMVKALLTQNGQEISARDKGIALHWAAKNGRLNVIQFLLTQAGQEISTEDKVWALWSAAYHEREDVLSFLLETYGHELSFTIIKDIGFVRACKFYASRMATVIGKIWTTFAPPAPIVQPSLPSVTTESLVLQSELPPPTLEEAPTNAAKRKQELSPESTNNEVDAVNEEPPGIKRVKLR